MDCKNKNPKPNMGESNDTCQQKQLTHLTINLELYTLHTTCHKSYHFVTLLPSNMWHPYTLKCISIKQKLIWHNIIHLYPVVM